MSARHAILGLLVEAPRHGYAIDRLIEERGMRRWASIGFSSIYWVLDQLVADGLAEVAEKRGRWKGGRRRVFRPTDKGLRAWHEESLVALADPERGDQEFLVALSGLPALDPGRARAALEQRLQSLTSSIERMEHDRRLAGAALPPHVIEMFAFGRSVLEAQRGWLAGLLADRWGATTAPSPEATQRTSRRAGAAARARRLEYPGRS